MDIAERLKLLRTEIPEGVELVAVSKFHTADVILQAYDAGQRVFGESRVPEFIGKKKILPKDIRWHFIGHLQTNKVKQIIGQTALIESVDSRKLIDLIDAESRKVNIISNILLQVHVAKEETKFGFYPEELIEYFEKKEFEHLTNTHICGLMGMASNTDDLIRVRDDFAQIHNLYLKIKNDKDLGLRGFDRLSMGMSGDWQIAVEEGSNIIRIGSYIFGERG